MVQGGGQIRVPEQGMRVTPRTVAARARTGRGASRPAVAGWPPAPHTQALAWAGSTALAQPQHRSTARVHRAHTNTPHYRLTQAGRAATPGPTSQLAHAVAGGTRSPLCQGHIPSAAIVRAPLSPGHIPSTAIVRAPLSPGHIPSTAIVRAPLSRSAEGHGPGDSAHSAIRSTTAANKEDRADCAPLAAFTAVRQKDPAQTPA
jgi:hypothetical protein